jgi:hypothetical protein
LEGQQVVLELESETAKGMESTCFKSLVSLGLGFSIESGIAMMKADLQQNVAISSGPRSKGFGCQTRIKFKAGEYKETILTEYETITQSTPEGQDRFLRKEDKAKEMDRDRDGNSRVQWRHS